MGVRVGIDLGTTFSAVAWINPRTNRPEIILNSDDMPITPSVVQFREDGSAICGSAAKEAFEEGEYGCTSAFKRYMGTKEICCSAYGKEYTAKDLSAILLRHLKKEAEERLGQPVTEAVITVPAYFYNEEREDTLHAAQEAGLKVLRLINEPTAAALNYCLKHWRENAIVMVYDLGGGTFDITLIGMGKNLQLNCEASVGNHQLGGKDWDDCLLELIVDKACEISGINISEDQETMNQVKSQIEGWKKKLSQNPTITCKVRVPNYGPVELQVSREEFDLTTKHLLDQTRSLCEDLLAKKHISWNNITDILLVGGSTRMPQVAAFLKELYGKDPIRHVNPDEAVALGAAMQTTLEEEEYVVYTGPTRKDPPKENKGGFGSMFRKETTLAPALHPEETLVRKYAEPVQNARELEDFALIGKSDVQAHGMGIIVVNEEGTKYINQNIIPSNVSIPVKSAREFIYRGSDELEIFLLEGEGEIPDCQITAKYVASGIRKEKGNTRVRVQYSFDRNSIIHVQVRQGNEQTDLPVRKVPIDPEELEKFSRPIDPSEFRSSLTIVLALDVSGSMSGSPMQDAQKAMASFVDNYAKSGTEIGVIAVSDRVCWVQKPTSDSEACKKAIYGMTCGMTGYGNSVDPFVEILNELRSVDGDRYAIILADGVWSYQNQAITYAKKCNAAGIETAAIGFGSADKEFLNSISSQSHLSILTNQSGLISSFGKIAQSIGTGGGKGRKTENESITATWETND